jgi:GGDEF domain-containing protein
MALVLLIAWLVLATGAIGATQNSFKPALGWAILTFVAIVTLAAPVARAGAAASVCGAAAFAATAVAQLAIDRRRFPDALDGSGILVTCAAILLTPLVLEWFLAELQRSLSPDGPPDADPAVAYDNAVAFRDANTRAFRASFMQSIVADEVQRARRYHRAFTLGVIAADDWPAEVRNRGEVGARALAARILDQISIGTRTVDKIVEMGDGSFVLVLPETPLEGAEILAERLQAAASADAGVVVRIGLANFPRDAVIGDALIEEASLALRHARKAGLLVVDRTLIGRNA